MLATSDFPQFYHRSITGTYHIFILVAWFHDHIFKSYKTAISHSCEHPWRPNNIFSSITLRDIVLCIKSQTRLFIYFSSIVSFFQIKPIKLEKWHALSHEQYFSVHRFLDICRCTFNNCYSTNANGSKTHEATQEMQGIWI